MNKQWMVLAAAVWLLAGCATDPATVASLAQAHAEVAKVPTLVLECPSGCSARYTDPRDRPALRQPTNGFDAMVAVSGQIAGMISGAVPYAAIGAVAVRGLREAGDVDQSTHQIGPNSQNQTTHTTTTTDNSNQGNATATPTVVLQPAPVVVPQPEPVIVTQPAPIVITP